MIYAIIFFAVVILDQLTKAIVVTNSYERIQIIGNLFSIEKVTMNTGAALSMFADKPWAQAFFIVLTVITMAVLVLFFIYKKEIISLPHKVTVKNKQGNTNTELRRITDTL